MADFDRWDICGAYLAFENDWNKGGWLQERPTNRRRRQATSIQLARIGFSPGAGWDGYDSLSENGKEIYQLLQCRYGLFVHPSDARPGQLTVKNVGVLYLEDHPKTIKNYITSISRQYSLNGVRYYAYKLTDDIWRIERYAYEVDLKQVAK